MKYSATLLLCLALTACAGDEAHAPKSQEQPVKAAKAQTKAPLAWMDEYEPRLKAALQGSKMELERRERVLVVIAPANGTFNPDRPTLLLPAVLGAFTRVAKTVEDDHNTAVLILGHADTSGQPASNLTLSDERARAVASIFRLTGLRGDRLHSQGVGSDLPRADNSSSQGRERNRRVEIHLTEKSALRALVAEYTKPAAGPTSVAQVAAEQKKSEKAR